MPRIKYAAIILMTIILGLLSRKISWIPAITGDSLYAVMMYYICRFCFISKPMRFSLWMAIGICFIIEFSQVLQYEWIVEIRKSLFGRLVLGQGFLVSDLIGYILGASIAFYIDKYVFDFQKKGR